MKAETKEEIILNNGLTVLLLNDPTASTITTMSFVRAGSIDEGSLLGSGISHYLEHIVAGGTTDVKSEEKYKRIIASIGGAYNAYTTTDHTAYYINTTPDKIEKSIYVLYEWMFSFETRVESYFLCICNCFLCCTYLRCPFFKF